MIKKHLFNLLSEYISLIKKPFLECSMVKNELLFEDSFSEEKNVRKLDLHNSFEFDYSSTTSRGVKHGKNDL